MIRVRRPLSLSLWLKALLCLVAVISVPAHACTFQAESPPAAIAGQRWLDAAEVAFRIGRDYDFDTGRPLLLRRLHGFSSFAALRQQQSQWAQAHQRMLADAVTIMSFKKWVDRLQATCRDVDRADFDGVPLDRGRTKREIEAIRHQVLNSDRPLASLVKELQTASGTMAAAAGYYAGRGFAANSHLDLGPSLDGAAGTAKTLWLRWRAVHADLQFVAQALRKSVTNPSAFDTVQLMTAAQTLQRALDTTAGIVRAAPTTADVARIMSGSRIAARCPVPAGQWVVLANRWYKKTHGELIYLDKGFSVLMASFLMPTSVSKDPQVRRHFRFSDAGNGWWKIEVAGAPGRLLDVDDSKKAHYALRATKTRNGAPRYTGQYWRCLPDGARGEFRLANLFLGEGMSIDTYKNSPEAIMADTGDYAAQYWTVARQ